MADTKVLGNVIINELGDLGGLVPEMVGTVLVIGAALIKFIRSNGDSLARQEAMFSIAEEAKQVLDREKFPGEE